MSSRLTSESRIYADKARDLNRQVSFVWLVCVSMSLIKLVMQMEFFSSAVLFIWFPLWVQLSFDCHLHASAIAELGQTNFYKSTVYEPLFLSYCILS